MIGYAMQISANHFGVALADIRSRARQPAIVRARWSAWCAVLLVASTSHAELARLAGVDHTSVLYAARRHIDTIDTAAVVDLLMPIVAGLGGPGGGVSAEVPGWMRIARAHGWRAPQEP